MNSFLFIVRNPTPKIVSTNASVILPVAATSTTANDDTLEMLAAVAAAQKKPVAAQPLKIGEYSCMPCMCVCTGWASNKVPPTWISLFDSNKRPYIRRHMSSRI